MAFTSGCKDGSAPGQKAAQTQEAERGSAADGQKTSREEEAKGNPNEETEVVIATYRDAVQGSGDAFYCWEGTYVW